jgi:hypothetical protein
VSIVCGNATSAGRLNEAPQVCRAKLLDINRLTVTNMLNEGYKRNVGVFCREKKTQKFLSVRRVASALQTAEEIVGVFTPII